jgi:hypothetical protein
MDFVERALHIAPDYGSGSLETAIFLAILAAALTVTISNFPEWRLAGALRRLADRFGI